MRYVKSDLMGTPSAVLLPMQSGEQYTVGEALVVSDGKATKAGASVVPAYICGETATGTDNGTLTAYRVLPTQVWGGTLTADGAELAIGDKLTLAADGVDLTATTGGAAEIVEIVGTAVGDEVRVRFK